jgi:hypothetical protein
LANLQRWARQAGPRWNWQAAAEVAVIIAWALYVGKDFLNLDPRVWPAGGEFGWAVNAQYFWQLLPECGSCVLWNGYINGGSPAFAELHGTVLHPIVVISTLLWGAVNSAKVTVVASLITAGLAQWWLARLLKLGTVPRMWCAGMAVVGGHLAGRMQAGLFPLVLSMAFASLVIPAGLQLILTGTPRAVVGLGATLALLIVSGQAYLQLGVALAILPAFAVFLLQAGPSRRALWRQFALALGLGLVLAAVFLLPMAHFWPHFAKHLMPAFQGTQKLGDAALNLVISDDGFFRSPLLNKFPYPFIYVNYIGWVPVVLALFGLRRIPRRHSRMVAFFALAIVLVYVVAAAGPLRVLARFVPELATAARHPDLIAGLAVPLVLALAAWGLDEILKLNWPRLTLAGSSSTGWSVGVGIATQWLVVTLPLLWALGSARDFGEYWMGTYSRPEAELEIVEELVTADTQWVAPPYGEHFWLPHALDRGLKVTNINRPWFWKDRQAPPAFLSATRDQVDLSAPNFRQTLYGVHLFRYEENPYASVHYNDHFTPCQATARGGHIDVLCEAQTAGTLVVRENRFPGWTAYRDGAAVPLGEGDWLTVEAPAGRHTYQFRYRPWDATLGILLTLCGVAVAIWWWWRPPEWVEEGPRGTVGPDEPAPLPSQAAVESGPPDPHPDAGPPG